MRRLLSSSSCQVYVGAWFNQKCDCSLTSITGFCSQILEGTQICRDAKSTQSRQPTIAKSRRLIHRTPRAFTKQNRAEFLIRPRISCHELSFVRAAREYGLPQYSLGSVKPASHTLNNPLLAPTTSIPGDIAHSTIIDLYHYSTLTLHAGYNYTLDMINDHPFTFASASFRF